MKNKILSLVALLLTFSSISAFCQSSSSAALDHFPGVHRGHSVGSGSKDEFDLLVQPLAGSQGSYLAILIQTDPIQRADIYELVPHESENSFKMTPMTVDVVGFFGVNDANPSLVLNLNGQLDGDQPEMTVTTSNSGNTQGFGGPYEFGRGTPAIQSWTNLVSGNYFPESGNDRKQKMISIQPMSQDFVSTTSLLLGPSFQGPADLEEVAPLFFAMRAVAVLGTNDQRIQYPKKLGFFISQAGTTKFVMVNPEQDTEITVLDLNAKK